MFGTKTKNSSRAEWDVKLRDLIQKECGLYYKDSELKELRSKIKIRLKALGLKNTEQYHEYLTDPQNKTGELLELQDLLTIQHTFFFRNQPHFNALRNVVIPQTIKRKQKQNPDDKTIRIWSSACSYGQEPYSIAITALESLPKNSGFEIYINASDISNEALRFAKEGIYEERAMKYVSETYRKKYFESIDSKKGTFRVKDNLRSVVHFSHLNLVQDPYPFAPDIIFCRNVLIYFDQSTIEKLIGKFDKALPNEGSLFIGHSESFDMKKTHLIMKTDEDAIYYLKRTESFVEEEMKPVVKPTTPPRQVRKPIRRKVQTKHIEVETPQQPERTPMELIREALSTEDFENAMILIENELKQSETVEMLYWKAYVLANQNEFSKAKKVLESIVQNDTLFAPSHYLLGTIALNEQEYEEAEKYFKKALYLDNSLMMARFSLAMTYKQQEKMNQAVKEYENIVRSINEEILEQTIPYGEGMVYENLLHMCNNTLERIGALDEAAQV